VEDGPQIWLEFRSRAFPNMFMVMARTPRRAASLDQIERSSASEAINRCAPKRYH
jgi:hypothetical protein